MKGWSRQIVDQVREKQRATQCYDVIGGGASTLAVVFRHDGAARLLGGYEA